MKAVIKSAINISERARRHYRYYLYWLGQERTARRLSSDQIRDIQWEKFKKLLEFAYTHIPLYKDKFKEAGITPESIKKREDLIRIPILSKDEIRQNFPDRILDNSRKYPPDMMGRTSGSTGESLHFIEPDETWNRKQLYSVFMRTRTIKNIPILVLNTPRCTPDSCSLHDDKDYLAIKTNIMHRIRFLRHLAGMVGLPSSQDILCASDEYMERIAGIISSFSPCIMIVDPVYLGAFARYLKNNGKPIPKLSAIITTSELITGSLRDLFHEVFGCDAYNHYGASEVYDIASECEHHKLHVKTSTVLVECIRGGKPAGPGELGKAIITE